jgi:hypothetical protein
MRGAELLEEYAAKRGGRLFLLGSLRGKRNSEQEEECKLSHGCDLVVRRVYRPGRGCGIRQGVPAVRFTTSGR